MALGDITIYDEGAFGYPGDTEYVNTSRSVIYAGEPVAKALGNTNGYYVDAAATASPEVGTHYMAGIAATSCAVSAKVKVMKLVPGVTYLISPLDSTAWDTQAEYDALVGSRVLFDLTTGTYTIGHTDGAGYGLVVMPLNIRKYHHKVRFAIRKAVNYLA